MNALQVPPDINLPVSSSDFFTPQIEQALRTAGKCHPAGEPGHVLIASFDGDAPAYAMLAAGQHYAFQSSHGLASDRRQDAVSQNMRYQLGTMAPRRASLTSAAGDCRLSSVAMR
jgi:hypothetical protein